MSIEHLLVYAGRNSRAAIKMQTAIDFAKAFAASVTALYVIQPPPPPRYFEGYVADEALGQAVEAEEQRARTLAGEFVAACDGAGVPGEWVQMGGRDLDALARLFRYTDLIVMGQSSPDDPDHESQRDLPEDVVMTSGRPVLMLPHAVRAETIGRRVMVAWNRTREATRAVADALPILRNADEVIIYSINPPGLDHVPGSYLSDHLKRHDIDAEPKHTVAHDIDVAKRNVERGARPQCGSHCHERVRPLKISRAPTRRCHARRISSHDPPRPHVALKTNSVCSMASS